MKMTGAGIAVKALEDENISFIFGIPGTHNMEFYDSLNNSLKTRPIVVTSEQSASFMADGAFRSSGQLGALNLVPGAGLTHALSGIAEAFLDCIPMLILVSGVRTDTGNAFQLHDIDQLAVARPVTKAQFKIKQGGEIYATIRQACSIAKSAPAGPVIVEIPANLYFNYCDPNLGSWRDIAPYNAELDPTDLFKIRGLVNKSRCPILYVGLGAANAGNDLIDLAERLQSPVATTFQGKGVFPENHPLWLWCGLGASAPLFVRKILKKCDLVLAIGCRFSEVATGSYGFQLPSLAHIDIDPGVFNKNYFADLTMVADAKKFTSALLYELPKRAVNCAIRKEIQLGHAAVWSNWSSSLASLPFLFSEIQKLLGPETIYTTDSGNGSFWAIECLRLSKSGLFLAPIDYSCMGYAIPAAIGASLACLNQPVVAIAGDGAFLMTGLEILTAVRLRLPIMIIVLRDKEFGQIAQFQQTALGRKICVKLPDYNLSRICGGLAVECLSIQKKEDVDYVLKRALAINQTGSPVVIETLVDYSEKTYFTKGVISTNLKRLSWRERLRFALRSLRRGGSIF